MKDNKIILITGASSDVGINIIDEIEKDYSKILAHYNHSINPINELTDKFGDKIIPVQADFSDKASINEMLEKIKTQNMMPDHIIHLSAPKVNNVNFHKDNLERLDKELRVSVESIAQILLSCVPYMVKQKYGRIVFMLSSNVVSYPPKYQSFYTTSKYALLGMMKSLAAEYANKNIFVNAVSPSMIETKFLSEVQELIIQNYANESPMGRNLSVSDVVSAFKFLLSDETTAVTGVNIPITGGRI